RTGRREFAYRRAVVARSTADAVTALRTPTTPADARPATAHRPVVFLFPGGGAQYAGMGRGLYEREPVYREHLDRCARAALSHLGFDIRDILHPDPEHTAEGAERIKHPLPIVVTLFSVEYALARLWMSWGIRPEAMIGHSLGEYVAACLAGVFTLEDALALVCARGRLIEEVPEGAMLSVPLPEAEVTDGLGTALDLAAVNGPAHCVVSGPTADIAEFADELRARGIDTRTLHVRAAGHSRALEPVLGRFEDVVRGIKLNTPKIPYLSNVTGTWIGDEATDPAYWVAHLRRTVRFSDGLQELLRQGSDPVLLEVGPGRGLTSLADLHRTGDGSANTVTSLRHPLSEQDDTQHALSSLATLWALGADVDWHAAGGADDGHRVPLPGYPFEGGRYRLGGLPGTDPDGPYGASPAAGTPTVASGTAAGPRDAQATGALHERPTLSTPYVEPRDELERMVVDVWKPLLGYERVGADDNFYSLGGHSLLATRVVAQLRSAFDVALPLERILQAVTPAEQATVIRTLLLDELNSLTDEEAAGLLKDEEGRS
ncbi:acyltransferase domain-containing protein, partial [Streptomyces goshikiensis]